MGPKKKRALVLKILGIRHCPRCDRDLPLQDFHMNKSLPNGSPYCKECSSNRRWAQKADLRQKMGFEGLAWCTDCEDFLPQDQFNKNASTSNGLQSLCKEHQKESSERYRIANREKTYIASRRWYNSHREHSAAWRKSKRDAWTPEEREEYNRRAGQRNHARRAKKIGNGWEPYTDEDIIAAHGTACFLCGEEQDFSLKWPHIHAPTKEHAIPIKRGGPDTVENVFFAHWAGNNKKQWKTPEEYFAYLEKLGLTPQQGCRLE
jgi:hypothetical protein